MRPGRVLAIAWRDLRIELGGRRGWTLPALTAAILMPLATVPVPRGDADVVRVTGDVPASVLALPDVVAVDQGAALLFEARAESLRVHGNRIPDSVRSALDGTAPTVRRGDRPGPVLPGRTLWFALASASVLTGALAESIPGERERRTLDVLLTAGISRAELVLGKWAAWAGYGATSALLAALAASLFGTATPGPWLLPLPCVACAATALGLYLVRHAEDAVSGSLLAIRALPAVIAIAGLVSWAIGTRSPLLGAMLPLGGAVAAAGGVWEGWGPAILSAVTSIGAAAWLLWATARDIEAPPPERPRVAIGLAWVAAAATVAAPTYGPELWSLAGNPSLAPALPPSSGARAVALGLFCLVATVVARNPGILEARWWLPSAALAVACCTAAPALPDVGMGGLVLLVVLLGRSLTRHRARPVSDEGQT